MSGLCYVPGVPGGRLVEVCDGSVPAAQGGVEESNEETLNELPNAEFFPCLPSHPHQQMHAYRREGGLDDKNRQMVIQLLPLFLTLVLEDFKISNVFSAFPL